MALYVDCVFFFRNRLDNAAAEQPSMTSAIVEGSGTEESVVSVKGGNWNLETPLYSSGGSVFRKSNSGGSGWLKLGLGGLGFHVSKVLKLVTGAFSKPEPAGITGSPPGPAGIIVGHSGVSSRNETTGGSGVPGPSEDKPKSTVPLKVVADIV